MASTLLPNCLMLQTVAVIVTLMLIPCSLADECTQVNSCSCKFTNGSVIDISPLAAKGGSPRFGYEKAIGRTDDFEYAFNPCIGFNDTHICNNVVSCQRGNSTVDPTSVLYYPIGDANSAKFSPDGRTITYKSSSTADQITRTSVLYLVCDPTVKVKHPKFFRLGETNNIEYHFLLASVSACAV